MKDYLQLHRIVLADLILNGRPKLVVGEVKVIGSTQFKFEINGTPVWASPEKILITFCEDSDYSVIS